MDRLLEAIAGLSWVNKTAAFALRDEQRIANLIAYRNTLPEKSALRQQLGDQIEELLGIEATA